MLIAIYARKGTEQTVIADDQKSVARQVEHARQYAQRKGWTIADEHVYIDDGISGAEFANRPGFLRLMNSLTPRPPFQVLVMSEVSRLGREQIETAYSLKQLSTAGVRCFSYLEDRELMMESATDKFLLSAVNFAAKMPTCAPFRPTSGLDPDDLVSDDDRETEAQTKAGWAPGSKTAWRASLAIC